MASLEKAMKYLKNKFIIIDNHNNVNVPVKILNLRFI